MKYIQLLLLLILVSCHKENIEPEIESICSNCIYGNWELTSRIHLIDNDTIDVIENGKLTEFNNGVFQFKCKITLTIQENYFIFNENIEKYFGNDVLVNYQENWKWMNTSIPKSHVYMPIQYRAGGIESIHKIIKLTDEELIIEHQTSNSGIADYLLYSFRKIKSNSAIKENQEARAVQLPTNLIGTWKLDEFYYKLNDSVFSNFKCDTLTVQAYGLVGQPPREVKEIDKYYYNLSIIIDNLGYFKADEKSSKSNSIIGYWYWIDENNPHNHIYLPQTIEARIRPSIFNLIGYEIKNLDENFLELSPVYDESINDLKPIIVYKLKKEN